MKFLRIVAGLLCVLLGFLLLMGGMMSPENMKPIMWGVFFCVIGVLIWSVGKKRTTTLPPADQNVQAKNPPKKDSQRGKNSEQNQETEIKKIQIQAVVKDKPATKIAYRGSDYSAEDWEGLRVAIIESKRIYQHLFADIYESCVQKELCESGMKARQINAFLRYMSAREHQPTDAAHYCNPKATAEFCPPDFVWHRLKIVDGICAQEGFSLPAITSTSPAPKQWYAFLRFVREVAMNSAEACEAFLIDPESTARLLLSRVRKEDLPLIAFFQKNLKGLPPYFPEDGVSMATCPSGGRGERQKSMWELEVELQGVVLEFPLKNNRDTRSWAYHAEWMNRMGKTSKNANG